MRTRPPVLAFLVIGGACIVAGGLVSAVTVPLMLPHGSWVAAYLVLVAGCAQIGLGTLQERLAVNQPSVRVIGAEFGLFNLGNTAVIVGTLIDAPFVVDGGGLLLVAALAVFLTALRGSYPAEITGADAVNGRAAAAGAHPRRLAIWAFRSLVIVLLVSIPIGLTLAHLRPG